MFFSNVFLGEFIMRQKKSNWPFYIVGALLLAAVCFVVLHEVPLETQHVEEEISISEK